MTVIKKWSKVVGPLLIDDLKNIYVSKSQKLFLQTGLTRFQEGMGTLSPFLVRSLRKLERLVRKQMDEIPAQEILLPTLTNSTLLETSGRINLPDLFKLEKSGNKSYVLSPTHEEGITNFLSSINISYNQLPCCLYQISNKFRDEKRTKSGLLRSKEFVMKDLYCFNSSAEENEECFKQIINIYHKFFNLLKVPYISAKALPGDMGGLNSLEFHFLSDAGEDKIVLCKDCGHNENSSDEKLEDNCKKCQSKNITIEKGIEVGHAFNLGTTYTKPFNAVFTNEHQMTELLHMSCFGLGLTRILAASVEVLCTAKEIRWPLVFAPYLVCVIPPKAGSKEEKAAQSLPELIYQNLNQSLSDEIVYFDKTSMSIGKRFMMAKQIGFPFVIIIGKNIQDDPPLVEIHDVYSDSMDLCQISDVNQFVLNKLLGIPDNSYSIKENSV